MERMEAVVLHLHCLYESHYTEEHKFYSRKAIKIQGGLWYRHSLYNGDALITSFGVKKDFLKITYSFDLTLSQLSIRQGGSHEIGVIFNFDYLYPKKQDYNDCFAIFR